MVKLRTVLHTEYRVRTTGIKQQHEWVNRILRNLYHVVLIYRIHYNTTTANVL